MSSGPFEPEADQTSGPKLVDVSAESGISTQAQEPAIEPEPELESDPEPAPARRFPGWLMLVALVLFALLVGWQAQVASELKAEVAILEGQLEESQALLGAHRAHLSEIRGGVHELSESLLGLSALVDRDPTESLAEFAAEATEPTP